MTSLFAHAAAYSGSNGVGLIGHNLYSTFLLVAGVSLIAVALHIL